MARTKSNSTPSGQGSSATIDFEATAIPDFGPEHADTFRRDLHPDLRADTATCVSANPQPRSHSAGLLHSERQLRPPFNDSDWFRKDDDVRFSSLSASTGERAGVRCRNDLPPKGNANFAWVQHFIHHLAPHGMAGFVLANGSMSSNQSGDCNARSARRNWATDSQGLGSQRDIRRALIEADLVDCMVAQS